MRNYLAEVFKRRDLLLYLVRSGLKAENRNSYLGYFWWLLDPLLNVLVYYFLVVVILERGGNDFALFLVIGLVAWRWINTTVTSSAKSITKYRSIINQVSLPKSIFPLAFSITQLFNFAFGLIVVGLFLAVFGVTPGWQVVYLPLIILVQFLSLITISLFISYLTVFIRDIDNILSHIMRIFFYASPIIWPGGRLPEKYTDKYGWIVDYNPIAIIVNSYRDVLIHHEVPNLFGLLIIGGAAISLGLYMIYHYSKNEHKIIKAL